MGRMNKLVPGIRFLGLLMLVLGFCFEPPAGGAGRPRNFERFRLPDSLFHVTEDHEGWWWRASDGERFLTLGVCVFDPGLPRGWMDEENPAYAAWQHYPDTNTWAQDSLRRLKSWGFNTLGAWADFAATKETQDPGMYLTPVLHIGSTAGAPWWDMWDARNVARMHQVARDQIQLLRDHPRVIGYYSDNELGWWNATLWKLTFEQPASSAQRHRTLQLLRDHYGGDWTKLLVDFQPEHAEGWGQLRRGGTLFLRSGGQGIHVMRRFLSMLADRYYSLMREIIRTYDPDALYLGDRYQSFYYPEVARACGQYADVVSCNLNAHWSDGTFARCQLDTLHAITGKPIVVTEIYLAAMENSSGNRNTSGIYPVVKTQSERALALSHTLTNLSRLPYVVGVDWFQYYDEPRFGRGDGENFNFGLVDIHNRPYPEVTSVFSRCRLEQLRKTRAPFRNATDSGIPVAPTDPLGRFQPTLALMHWDREHGFLPATTSAPMADLYACWNTNAIYLGLFAFDIVEEAYYRGPWIPKEDRALWTLRIGDAKPYHVRLGGEREAIPSDLDVRIEHLSGGGLNVKNVAAVELTASRLGRTSFRAGDTIELEATLWSHCRAQRVEWKGIYQLKSDARSLH
jgi:hypothetical protein